MPKSIVKMMMLSSFAIFSAVTVTSCLSVPEVEMPEPVVSWSCAFPPGTQTGDEISSETQTFPVNGSDDSLRQMRILPYTFQWGSPKPVLWIEDPTVGHAVSNGYDAFRAGVLQIGAGGGKLNNVTAMTLFIRFKMNSGMTFGGPPPGAEMDGQLMRLAPGAILGIRGHGGSGKAPHVPFLELRCKDASGNKASWTIYQPGSECQVRTGEWTTLVMTWNSNANATDGTLPTARMWVNAKEAILKCEKNPLPAGARCPVDGPITLGGDRSYGNVAMALSDFSIYDMALTPEQATFLSSEKKNTETLKASESASTPSAFENHPELNKPDAWSPEGSGMIIEDAEGKALLVKIPKEDFGKEIKLLLKHPLPLNGAKWVNLWHYVEPKCRQYSYTVEAIFEKPGAKESYQPLGGGYDGHIGTPNSRASGLWKYHSAKTPNPSEGILLKGLKITVKGPDKASSPGEIYLCDLGLERIDYKKTSLYYVVGGYRDNLSCVGFNSCGARAMSDFDGGVVPFVRLDNLLDYAKHGRPKKVNLCVSVYDIDDRPVFESRFNDLASVTTVDAFQRIEIPVCVPGTYRIKSKSYNAATGAYFTTDWCQLIVLKGSGKANSSAKKKLSFSINPDKPFGRLEPGDKKTIAFNFEAKDWPYPIEMKYAVIPYSTYLPGWSAMRPVKFERSMTITGAGRVEIPYEPAHCVEMVVAEVWKDKLLLDREERPIGIRNELDKAPAPDVTKKIPTLSDITANNGIWMNSQIHDLQNGEAEYFKANLGELKKLTPISGFGLDIDHAEPIPGVYNWDLLDGIFDTAAQQGCRILPYMAQKWPAEWMPVEFIVQADSSVHHGSLMWGYMVGKYNYCTGKYGPDALRQFNQQLARKYLNHPGLAGFYFENEHFGDYFSSHDAGNRKRFSDFLKGKYGSVKKLNTAWGSSYSDFSQAPIPTLNPDITPRKTILADFSRFRDWWLDRFSMECQFDAVRKEDPRHPILVYYSVTSKEDLTHIANNGGMMANGGVHADMGSLLFRETYAGIPGLMERMEPHGMWDYEPIPYGYDEMIFGMLPMGGRGLNFHFFLGGNTFDFKKYENPNPLSKPPLYPRNGYARILETMPLLKELRSAERIYDQIGIMSLRTSSDIFGMPYRYDTGGLANTIVARRHYGARVYFPKGELARLDSCKVLFIANDVLSAEEALYLKDYILKGGSCVMDGSAAKYCLDDAENQTENYLLSQLGINTMADGEHIAGIGVSHDVHKIGKGQLLLFHYPVHPDIMVKAIPLITAWAGIPGAMADSDDPDMLMYVLQSGETYYLVTDHSIGSHNNYQTNDWTGKLRFSKTLPKGNYEVADIWNGGEKVVMTPEQLALGFDAGLYHNKQMKIFRIRLADGNTAK